MAANLAARRNDEGDPVAPTFEVGDLVRHIPMGDGQVLELLGGDLYKVQFDHGHIVEMRAGWYLYKVGTVLAEEALACPKCNTLMVVAPDTRERSCTCGLKLPPYPLEWATKGLKGGRRDPPPAWIMTLAFELADNYGPLASGRLLDIHPNVISGWRNKYRKDKPRWATGPHAGPRTRRREESLKAQSMPRSKRIGSGLQEARSRLSTLANLLKAAVTTVDELTTLAKEK